VLDHENIVSQPVPRILVKVEGMSLELVCDVRDRAA
jgi:hypothetical protein